MLTYFLQVNLCWLLFYGLYYVLLSRETFFTLNRIYLIISLLAGLVLPFTADWLRAKTPLVMPFVDSIMLPTFVVGMQGQVDEMVLPLNAIGTEGGNIWTWWTVISAIYFIGVGVMSMRFLVGLYRIVSTFKTANFDKKDGFVVAYTEGVLQPFSFFIFIFINKRTLQDIDFQNIMQHEKAHARQGHSFDVVFLELLNIVFWFSPLIYLYKNSLRIVHEYLADAAVLRSVSKRQYGTLLIQQSQGGKAFALTNPFFSQLKKRIIMMTRNPSKRRALVKYVLAFPIFLLLVSFLAIPDNAAMTATETVSDKVSSKINDFDDKILDFKFAKDSIKKKVPSVFASINGKYGWLSVEEVQKLDKIELYGTQRFSKFLNPIGADIGEVMSFFVELTIHKKVNGESISTTQIAKSNSGKFTDEIRQLFRNAENGHSFHFKNIVFKMKKEPFLSWNMGETFIEAIDKKTLDRWANLPILPQIVGKNEKGNGIMYRDESGDISLDVFKTITELDFHRTDYDYVGTPFGDAVYTLTRMTDNGKNSYSSNENSNFDFQSKKFSEIGVKLIQDAQEGDVYKFTKIRFTEKDKKPVDIGDMTFYIKNNAISDERPITNPDLPIHKFADRDGGMVTKDMFKKYSEVKLIDPKTGKYSKYELESLIFIRVPRNGDPVQLNWSAKNKENLKTLIDKAQEGDSYNFMSIKVRYPGSSVSIDIGGMNFFISDNSYDIAPSEGAHWAQPQGILYKENSLNKPYGVTRDTSLPVLSNVEELPRFVGGQDSMFRWIGRNIRYPAIAREKQVEGTVYVGFVVETDGSISDVKVKREPTYPKDTLKMNDINGMQGFKLVTSPAEGSLGRETVRMIKAMPRWIPGRDKGKPVRVAYTLPIKFKLE
jgi:BlaR1 peptidase M56/Gram-negative bacterial TonB protein C-terminal